MTKFTPGDLVCFDGVPQQRVWFGIVISLKVNDDDQDTFVLHSKAKVTWLIGRWLRKVDLDDPMGE